MQREISAPTFSENRGLFEVFWMAREEGRRGLPLRIGHDLHTPEQHWYQKGYEAGLALKEE